MSPKTLLIQQTVFVTYNLTGHPFTPAIVFSSLAILNVSVESLGHVVISLSHVDGTLFALKHVEAYLMAEDESTDPAQPGDSNRIIDADFVWETRNDEEKTYQLNGVNLTIPIGLTMVIGNVAAGKSSLLSAIAGEMRMTRGSAKNTGSKAYCSQKPWIRSATVRENILFGADYDAEWYAKVVWACALEPDFQSLPDGDQTAIGELGINLSGGQKARVSTARAIYQKPNMLIADDVRVSCNCIKIVLMTIASVSCRFKSWTTHSHPCISWALATYMCATCNSSAAIPRTCRPGCMDGGRRYPHAGFIQECHNQRCRFR